MRKYLMVGLALCALLVSAVRAADTSMVLNVAGDVLVENFGKTSRVQPFSRLLEGDRVKLGADGKLTVVYVLSGRQEMWSGTGIIATGEDQSTAVSGSPSVQVRQLPKQVVQQMTRTPLADATGKAGMVRMRAIATPDALATLEQKYHELRGQAAADDRGPEIFFLAGLFEKSAYERLEQELERVSKTYPNDESMQVLAKLYVRAINNARQAGTP